MKKFKIIVFFLVIVFFLCVVVTISKYHEVMKNKLNNINDASINMETEIKEITNDGYYICLLKFSSTSNNNMKEIQVLDDKKKILNVIYNGEKNEIYMDCIFKDYKEKKYFKILTKQGNNIEKEVKLDSLFENQPNIYANTETSLNLKGTANQNDLEYDFYLSKEPNSLGTKITTQSSENYTYTNLDVNTKYYFTMKARNSTGIESISKTIIAMIQQYIFDATYESPSIYTFTAPETTKYSLDIYGGQGGNGGGLGGYAGGYVNLNAGDQLFVCIGGAGSGMTGGYNGGGAGSSGTAAGGGGGGATHIAKTNRGTLNNYYGYSSELLLVAGGGGGRCTPQFETYPGGTGGGASGGVGAGYFQSPGATQTSGYAFGIGQNAHASAGGGFQREGNGGGRWRLLWWICI